MAEDKGFFEEILALWFHYKHFDVQALLDSAMRDLFVKMQNPDHCLYQLLPPERSTTNLLRERGHNFELYEYSIIIIIIYYYRLLRRSSSTIQLNTHNKIHNTQ